MINFEKQNCEKIAVNLSAIIVIVIVIWIMVFTKNVSENKIYINEISKTTITDDDIKRLKEFEEKFGEPLFVSYIAYLKEDEFLDGTYKPDFLDKYLIKENEKTILLLKGIFSDFENFKIAENTTLFANSIDNTSLIYGSKYLFDVESFTTLEVQDILTEENKYKVVLKSSSNIYYEYSNLASVANMSIGDIILPRKKIGEGVGKVAFSMYTVNNEDKIYINPYNFLKLLGNKEE